MGGTVARTVEQIVDDIGRWANCGDELEKRGVRGDRDCPTSCPMANYILTLTDPSDVKAIWVDFDGVVYTNSNDDKWYIPAPDNMSKFIEEFDEGLFPTLDNHPEPQ